jgi:hypothetical protein
MLETISGALLIYLGQRVIDLFWSHIRGGQHAVVDQTGRIGTTSIQSGEPLISPAVLHSQSPMTGVREAGQAPRPHPAPDFAPPPDFPEPVADQDELEVVPTDQDELEVVEVKVFLPPAMSNLEEENTISVAFIVSAEYDEATLAAVDLAQQFNVELLPGEYSFYTLVLDPTAANFLDSYTFAVGLPATVNLDDFDQFTVADFEALLDITSDEPLPVLPGEGPYELTMVLLSLDELDLASSDDRRLGAILGLPGY